jgi:hypothetical protein
LPAAKLCRSPRSNSRIRCPIHACGTVAQGGNLADDAYREPRNLQYDGPPISHVDRAPIPGVAWNLAAFLHRWPMYPTKEQLQELQDTGIDEKIQKFAELFPDNRSDARVVYEAPGRFQFWTARGTIGTHRLEGLLG